ncbi:HAMP domain-containing sensor histidine kinase [Arthrobacter sp. UYEF20]|uniref:sensor histidine kinase n=1 Tax=Arthrobacter sp. UYEF20 TaxID=1756363 RepID=UPI003398EB14
MTTLITLMASGMLVSGAATHAVQVVLLDNRANREPLILDDGAVRLAASTGQLATSGQGGPVLARGDAGLQRGEILQSLGTYGATSLLTLLAASLVAYLVVGRLLRPLRRLRDAAERLSLDDCVQRVPLPSSADDDVAMLAASFNAMMDRFERGGADIRQFLDDASHQLGTPVAVVRRHIELLSADDDGDVADVARTRTRHLVLKELDRMQLLVSDFQVLAGSGRPDFIHAEWIDVDQFLHDAMHRASSLGRRRWILSVKPGGWVLADPVRLAQAVDQLAANAVQSTSELDMISLGGVWAEPPAAAMRNRPSAAGAASALIGGLELFVADTGSGIPAEEHQRIFERFAVSGPNAVGGRQRPGLPIVKAIAEAHAGSVHVHSAPRSGNRFTLWLPARLDSDRQLFLGGHAPLTSWPG